MDKAVKNKALLSCMIAILMALCLAAPGSAFAYTQKETIVNDGHGTLYNESYLVVHETANPGASAYNHMLLYSRGYDYAVQYVMELDGSTVYHCMNDDRKAWAIGNGNSHAVNIELAHATNQADFNKQWNEAVKWCGDYLHSRGWDVSHMISHNEARLKWGGTDHTDPDSYFATYGKSWAQFKAAVASYMNTGNFSQATGGSTASNGGSSSSSAAHTGTGFGGAYTCMASSLNIRSAPSTSASVVGSYSKGGHVVLDDWYTIRDGYVWGRYTAYSGNIRYVAVGKPTGGYDPSDYLVKGGTASGSTSSASSNRDGGWYTVDVNTALNVRTGPGTNYRITGQLHDGYDLYVQSISNGWAKYQAYTGTRYVSAQYLD